MLRTIISWNSPTKLPANYFAGKSRIVLALDESNHLGLATYDFDKDGWFYYDGGKFYPALDIVGWQYQPETETTQVD